MSVTTTEVDAIGTSVGASGDANKQLTVKWVKSAIGYDVRQKRTLKALGFSKLGQTVVHDDTPQIRGMLNAVKHLVEVK